MACQLIIFLCHWFGLENVVSLLVMYLTIQKSEYNVISNSRLECSRSVMVIIMMMIMFSCNVLLNFVSCCVDSFV